MSDLANDRRAAALDRALGPIKTWLSLDDVREVIAGSDGRLWVERSGEALACVGNVNRYDIESAIRHLAAEQGVSVGPSSPRLAAMLWGRVRVQAMLPPVATAPTMTFRRLSRTRWTLDDYEAQGVMTGEQHGLMVGALEAYGNILISGATGSGKTTLVAAMLRHRAVADQRIILIEDTPEIDLDGLHAERLTTTPTIDQAALVRDALRMRPDRLMIGEVRGPEALDLVMALNTGHRGGICTLHANSAEDAMERLWALCEMSGAKLDRAMLARAIDVVIHLERGPKVAAIAFV